jgi:hypothetical protein
MKRDMELARNILHIVEDKCDGSGYLLLTIDGYTEREVCEHVWLLSNAGLLQSDRCGHPIRLTWAGHEFLANISDDTVWNSVKQTVKEKGGAVSFDVLKLLALQAAKSVFGLV